MSMELKNIVKRIVSNNYSPQDVNSLFNVVVKHACWYLSSKHIDSSGLFDNYWDFAIDFSARIFSRNEKNEFIYFKRLFKDLDNLTENEITNKIRGITFKNLKQELSQRLWEFDPLKKLSYQANRTFQYLHKRYNTGLTRINVKKIVDLSKNSPYMKSERLSAIVDYYYQYQTEYEDKSILINWIVQQHVKQFKPKLIEERTPFHDLIAKEHDQLGKSVLTYIYSSINFSKRLQKTSGLQAIILREVIQDYIVDYLNNQCLESYSMYFEPYGINYRNIYRARFEYLTKIAKQKIAYHLKEEAFL